MAAIKTDLILQAITKGFDKVNKDLARTNKSLDSTKKKGAESSSKVSSLGKAFGGLGTVLASLGLAVTVKQIGEFIVGSTMLAARVETLGVVTQTLGSNAGYTTLEIRKLERGIEAQGITTQGSRQALALMMQAQLDLADSSDLARLAQDAAVVAGTNSTEAFQRLVNVITSGNVRMARTMGLQVNFNQGYQKLAIELGKSTDALTAQEKAQSRVNTVMGQGSQIAGAYEAAMDTVGKQISSTPRYWEQYKVAIGETNIGLLGFINTLTQKALKAETEQIRVKHLQNEALRTGILTGNEVNTQARLLYLGTLDYNDVIVELTDSLDAYDAAMASAKSSAIGTLEVEEEQYIMKLKLTNAELTLTDAEIAANAARKATTTETGKATEAIKLFTREAVSARVWMALWDEFGADGFISSEEKDILYEVGGMLGVDLPADTEFAITAFNDFGGAADINFGAAVEWLETLTGEPWHVYIKSHVEGYGLPPGVVPPTTTTSDTGVPAGFFDRPGHETLLPEPHAKGGQIGKGWSMLGEEGFELVDPSGFVYTHEQSKNLLMAGLSPEKAYISGGDLFGGATGALASVFGGRAVSSIGSAATAGVMASTSFLSSKSSLSGSPTSVAPLVTEISRVAEVVVDLVSVVETSAAANVTQTKSAIELVLSSVVRQQDRQSKKITDLLAKQNLLIARLPTSSDMNQSMKNAVGDLL